LRRDDYLPYYATQFNALELNFTYYQMPSGGQLKAMIAKTERKVQFSVKGNQNFTHHIELCTWKTEVKNFRCALTPLLTENLLSSVLLQFPQSFHYEKDTRHYLSNLIAEFVDIPLVVEFRHNSWLTERVFQGLRDRSVALCACDMPELKNLPVFNAVVTSGLAYMRFHGRNAQNWHGTNSRDRYFYDYPDAALAAYKPKLLAMQSKSKTLQIFFNNHAKAAAALNAKKLMTILDV
jgi:uncharacterized protein YecE (DUF72 family)